jgi:hypothetical protein
MNIIFSMENAVHSAEDVLIDNLKFQLPPTGSYIENRRSVTFFPSNSNTFNPTSGTRVVRIPLTSNDWLDPSTIKIFFKYYVVGEGASQVIDFSPAMVFQRFRLICQGIPIEDINYFNRTYKMFHLLLPFSRRQSDYIEGFLPAHPKKSGGGTVGGVVTPVFSTSTDWVTAFMGNEGSTEFYPLALESGGKQQLCFTPLSGIFAQNKFLPLRYTNLVLELELIGSGEEITISTTNHKFSIDDVQLKCDVVTIDSQLNNNFFEVLKEGSSLPIPFSTYSVSQHVLTPGTSSQTISISRAVSRLKTIFITLYKDTLTETIEYNVCNLFYHPMASHNPTVVPANEDNTSYNYLNWRDETRQVGCYVNIGSRRFPDGLKIMSFQEAFTQLKNV